MKMIFENVDYDLQFFEMLSNLIIGQLGNSSSSETIFHVCRNILCTNMQIQMQFQKIIFSIEHITFLHSFRQQNLFEALIQHFPLIDWTHPFSHRIMNLYPPSQTKSEFNCLLTYSFDIGSITSLVVPTLQMF